MNVLKGKVFNHGEMQRDFTYIDDLVEAVARFVDHQRMPNPNWSGDHPDPASGKGPWRLYNIGDNNPVQLMYLMEVLERCLGRKSIKEFLPMQLGDVPATYADIDDLAKAVDFKPRTLIEDGVERFARWYRDCYRV